MTPEELKALAEQYKRAQKSGDTALAELAREAAKAFARGEGATAEGRIMASFINDA